MYVVNLKRLSMQVVSCKVFFILSIMTVATIIRGLPRTQKETLLLLIALFYTIICCSLVHSFSSFGGRKAARKTQRRASSFFHQCSTAPLMALSTAVDNDEQEKQKQYLPVAIVDAMPEPLPANLKNFYYLLRHGQSTSNVAGVISSNAAELAYTEKHGLTELGRKQGKISANALLAEIKKNIQMKLSLNALNSCMDLLINKHMPEHTLTNSKTTIFAEMQQTCQTQLARQLLVKSKLRRI